MNKIWYTRTQPDDLQGLIADDSTGRNVAVSYEPTDAHLIAAAPELLDALTDMVNYVQDDSHFEPPYARDLIRAAYAAIYKAKGE